MKFNPDDAASAIGEDILWHENNPDKALSRDYQKGFINGLIQARYIIGELASGEAHEKRTKPGVGNKTMNHHTEGHFIEKCQNCKRVIAQCRCMDANKEVRWSICPNCAGLAGEMNKTVDHTDMGWSSWTHIDKSEQSENAPQEYTRELEAENDWQNETVAYLNRLIDTLASIIEKLCIELKKDNSIKARRNQAKIQYDRMLEAVGRGKEGYHASDGHEE